jgi:hypothetical protein
MPVRRVKGSWWIDFSYDRIRYRKRSIVNSKQGAEFQEWMMRREVLNERLEGVARHVRK